MSDLHFAHLSDLHLPLADARPPLRALMSKRLFSYLSWRRSRRKIHRPEVLAAVMGDVRAAGAAHLLVTGDLVNLALPDEFERARDWLATQGGADQVTVTPGNHDALVAAPWAAGLGQWSEWMGEAAARGESDVFPFVKRVGEAALIGVSTAVPTPPFMASGRVGDVQLLRLARQLALLRQEGAFRIVMLHHPLTEGAVPLRKALDDRAGLRQVLMEFGAELVLHGHSHHATLEEVAGPDGMIPVVAAPSASADPAHSSEGAGWRQIRIAPGNEAWKLTVVTRSIGHGGAFSEGPAFERMIRRPTRDVVLPSFV